MAESKVQFNLKNVHYAILTETETSGSYSSSWATPVAVPGAVSISLTQAGDETNFYADGVKYFTTRANQGYSGSIEMAHIPDAMLKAVWGYQEHTTDKVITESNVDDVKHVALQFQIDGDASSQLYVLYKCFMSRPPIGSQTNTESKEPQPVSLDISASPLLEDGKVLAKTTAQTSTSVSSAWFSSVWHR